jgi:SAM-dependent methyltransferase
MNYLQDRMTRQPDNWEKHWDRYAGSAEENPAQTYRRMLVLKQLRLSQIATRVVDIGSGSGDLAAELRRRYPQVELLGLELTTAGVELARRKVPNAVFLECDLLGDPEADSRFRAWGQRAVCSEVLEHVDHPEVLLRNATRYLQPGCRIVVTVPGGPRSAFDRHIGHRRHYTVKELGRVLESAGLELERVKGAGFPFFNLYKLTVIARGRRVIDDVARSTGGEPASRAARVVMRVFGLLLRANLNGGTLGWQLVAVARVPS